MIPGRNEYKCVEEIFNKICHIFLTDYFSRVQKCSLEANTDLLYWNKRVIQQLNDLSLRNKALLLADNPFCDLFDYRESLYLIQRNWYIEDEKFAHLSILRIYDIRIDYYPSRDIPNKHIRRCIEGRNDYAHENIELLSNIISIFGSMRKICQYLPIEKNEELCKAVYSLLVKINEIERQSGNAVGWNIHEVMTRNKHDYTNNLEKSRLTKEMSNMHQTDGTKIINPVVTAISNQDNAKLSVGNELRSNIKDIDDYIIAAENGNSDAQYHLCVYYENGIDVQIDKKKAVEWLCKSASAGNIKALNKISRCYSFGVLVDKDEKKAFYWNELAAKKGVAEAQNRVGHYYCCGYGVEKDEKKAVEWFFKAAIQGDAVAQYNLGICFRNGYGVEKDDAKAVEWYAKSSEQGDMKAQSNLGIHYERGEGVKKDFEKAFKLYTESANQGWADGQCNLASCYYRGIGVEKDVVKAIEWYIKSANQGCLEAQTFLKTYTERNE